MVRHFVARALAADPACSLGPEQHRPLVRQPALSRLVGSVRRLLRWAARRTRSVFDNNPVGPAVHPPAIVVVVVGLGHLTHRQHIFHESHVPSQQTRMQFGGIDVANSASAPLRRRLRRLPRLDLASAAFEWELIPNTPVARAVASRPATRRRGS